MDSKELRGLVEAYSEVYAPQEVDEATAMAKRGYDEAPIRQKIAKSTGGGEAADRASALEKKSTFGGAKKAKQRTDYARKQRGDFRKTTSSSPGLHVGQHKSDDAGVKAKQAARGAQRGALTPVEKKQLNREEFDIFDIVLEFLQVEGFAETLEEAEWMMANIIDEEAIGIILGEDNVNEIFGLGGKSAKDRLANSDYMKKKNKEADEKAIQNLKDMMSKDPERQKRPSRINNEGYQRNPEKGEKEDKKSAPVRGEKTPMPPRGDKRREDFEKWYAKQMGR